MDTRIVESIYWYGRSHGVDMDDTLYLMPDNHVYSIAVIATISFAEGKYDNILTRGEDGDSDDIRDHDYFSNCISKLKMDDFNLSKLPVLIAEWLANYSQI